MGWQEHWSTQSKTCPSAILYTTGQWVNLGLHSKRPSCDHLSHGTASWWYRITEYKILIIYSHNIYTKVIWLNFINKVRQACGLWHNKSSVFLQRGKSSQAKKLCHNPIDFYDYLGCFSYIWLTLKSLCTWMWFLWYCLYIWMLWFNPLPCLTLQSAQNLNVACRLKRSKALFLSSS